MNRFGYKQLLDWKNSRCGNILVLGGAPGVGKTKLALDFAAREFNKYLYINVDSEKINDRLNEVDFEAGEIIILIDNVKGDRKLLNEIYLLSCEYKSVYFVFIDTFIKDGHGDKLSIPLSYIVLYPMTFEEFLFNCNPELYNELNSVGSIRSIDISLNKRLMKVFSHYLFTGGMPQVVKLYMEKGMISEDIRTQQKVVLHNLMNKLRIYYKTIEYKNLKSVLDSISLNLTRDNKKFKLSDISRSKRFTSFKKYFDKLSFLNITYTGYTLRGGDRDIDEKSFLLYLFDTGLLGLIGGVPVELYDPDKLLTNNISLGLCQNFVANELKSSHIRNLLNWNHNMSRIEFIIKSDNDYIPIELKDDSSGKLKSLDSFNHYYKYKKNIRLNDDIYSIKGKVETFPIYLANILYRSLIS